MAKGYKFIIFFTFLFCFSQIYAVTIVLLGLPASGKGTLAERLNSEKDFISLSTGDLVRKEMFLKTDLGLHLQELIDTNQPIPDEIIHKLLTNQYEQALSKNHRIIIDGFPRSEESFHFLINLLKQHGEFEKTIFVKVDCEEEICLSRVIYRRVCSNCMQIYNLKYRPPEIENVCDKCGGALVTRFNDSLEEATRRIKHYKANILPFFDKGAQYFPSMIIHTGDQVAYTLGYKQLLELVDKNAS